MTADEIARLADEGQDVSSYFTNKGKMMRPSDKQMQERPPNFRDVEGRLFLVRCFVCDPVYGRENYAPSVATGRCAWCGWEDKECQVINR